MSTYFFRCCYLNYIFIQVIKQKSAKGYLEKLVKSYSNFNDPDYDVTDTDKAKMKKDNGEETFELQPIPLQ